MYSSPERQLALLSTAGYITTVFALASGLPGRRRWHPTPALLPGKSHGWRSLVAVVHGVAKGRTRLSDFAFTSLSLDILGLK